jgi:hypothetical protein
MIDKRQFAVFERESGRATRYGRRARTALRLAAVVLGVAMLAWCDGQARWNGTTASAKAISVSESERRRILGTADRPVRSVEPGKSPKMDYSDPESVGIGFSVLGGLAATGLIFVVLGAAWLFLGPRMPCDFKYSDRDRAWERLEYEREHETNTLLRAATPAEYDKRTLLRAAGPGSAEMHRLLRPIDEPNQGDHLRTA